MLDNHNERDGRSDRERPLRPADDLGQVSDREVPFAPVASSDVINRWLDGEIPEPAGLRGEAARSVDFWRQVGVETDRRRQMVTPAHVQANIMAALPPLATVRGEVEPWFRKDLRLTALTAIAAGAAIFTLGMIVARAFLAR